MKDRVGLGWRPELAAATLVHAGSLDVLEVLADEWLGTSRRKLRPLRTLGEQIPVVLHGVSLGLAGSEPVDPGRLAGFARLVAEVQPEAWSEHLAFVRAGGLEIGHLAAPPRTPGSIEALRQNVARARDAVGSAPWLENVATLVDPPGSTLDESAWLGRALAVSGCDLLLDLHNLHANATNFGFDAMRFIDALPPERVRAVHLAGGRRVRGRVLDDHLHDVPEAVYALLARLAERAPAPLTVVLERDGEYPPFEALLAQLERARAALAEGRRRRAARARESRPALPVPAEPGVQETLPSPDLDASLQRLLARIYVSPELRARFLADPLREAYASGLDRATSTRLVRLDGDGLALAAESFAHKRARQPRRPWPRA